MFQIPTDPPPLKILEPPLFLCGSFLLEVCEHSAQSIDHLRTAFLPSRSKCTGHKPFGHLDLHPLHVLVERTLVYFIHACLPLACQALAYEHLALKWP